jgi:hypothetical protein
MFHEIVPRSAESAVGLNRTSSPGLAVAAEILGTNAAFHCEVRVAGLRGVIRAGEVGIILGLKDVLTES